MNETNASPLSNDISQSDAIEPTEAFLRRLQLGLATASNAVIRLAELLESHPDAGTTLDYLTRIKSTGWRLKAMADETSQRAQHMAAAEPSLRQSLSYPGFPAASTGQTTSSTDRPRTSILDSSADIRSETRQSSPDTSAGISPDTSAGISPDINTGISPDTSAGISPDTSAGISPDINTGRGAGTRSPIAGKQGRLAGRCILVVEDNDLNAFIALKYLEREGATAVLARNGMQALERLAESHPLPEIILLDVQMPGMDGMTVSRAIRDNVDWNNIPIFALTADNSDETRQQAKAAGMDDYFTKPVDFSRLAAAIARRLDSGLSPTPVLMSSGHQDVTVLDHEEAIKLLGSRDLYISALEVFMKDGSRFLALTSGSWKAEDKPTAGRYAHTLKGLAATIGAGRLRDSAATIENLCKSPSADQNPDFRTLETNLVEAIKAAEHFISQQPG
jgi:CheY-like chemotaxis protein/HPt (histidine-containing phosphotransfer) domain-containing protein